MDAMRERPIIFSGESVAAIFDGCKTVTRRVIRDQRWWEFIGGSCDDRDDPQNWGMWCGIVGESREAYVGPGRERIAHGVGGGDYEPIPCPYGAPGDRLWGRERWFDGTRWRSPIYMPRRASRLTLAVVDVRAERLHAITSEDVRREGIIHADAQFYRLVDDTTLVAEFARCWNELNHKRGYQWADNPWVWRVEFTKVAP